MAKIFYTERDIDDLKARGLDSLDVNDNIVLTDLALDWLQRRAPGQVRRLKGINRDTESVPATPGRPVFVLPLRRAL